MKNIFKSKTFWLNLLAIVTTIVPVLPVNIQQHAVPALAVGNIILRKLTKEPVSVLPQSDGE